MTSETVSIIAAGIALLAAAGAWAAVLVNRLNATDTIKAQVNIGARNSRATVVSANRQKWIDAVRDDVAELSAARAHASVVETLLHSLSPDAREYALEAEGRQLNSRLHMLRARVEMRMNHTEDDHLALMEAMDTYLRSAKLEDALAMRAAGRKIYDAEWRRLKKEASGIDPFVREGEQSAAALEAKLLLD